MKDTFYPVRDVPPQSDLEALGFGKGTARSWHSRLNDKSLRATPTGEYRPPKQGEWFFSGAIVECYRAKKDMTQSFWIARLVRVRVVTVVVAEDGSRTEEPPDCPWGFVALEKRERPAK